MVSIKKCLAASCIAASLFVVGCRNGQELALAKGTPRNNTVKTQHPRFMDNVVVGGNATTNSVKTQIPATVHTTTESTTVSNTNPCSIPMPERTTTNFKYKESALTEDNFLSSKYAMVLGILPTAITNYSLYHFIEDWYGTRYRMGGKDRSGIDCSAFVQKLYEDVFGTPVVRTALEQFNACQRVFNQSELKEGDLVFFRIRGKRISHVGVYLANDYFVHASASQGVMISNLNEGYWSRFFAGAGKML
ncbi:MAG TPA: NlpC/P60 family protein [Flavipsychrobacter sp.]|nr:NlpC/P60 family protein [Flavipsychrobacter sp.]